MRWVVESLFGISLLVGLALFIVCAVVLGKWLLGPVNRAAGNLNAPTRFLLTDFIWLMIQLQLLFGFVMNWIEGATSERWLLVLVVALSVPVVVLWGASVSVVSRAGIVQPLRRAVLILVIVPGALAVIMAAPVLIVGSLIAFMQLPLLTATGRLNSQIWLQLAYVLVGGLLAAAFGFGVRWLSHWVLAKPVAAASTVGGAPLA